ncbi:tyrosine-type recombinase/integrase [Marinimicrococcus flavescens]|uniref:Integrase arm-type DNA-binding domain-containing protein n=1 Tax=Marinimicrococcus flavescens TaxID=3031815 RepID=A0AAP3XR76_9PROT|nr:integrase arm-type DNA-binding domain-containing protein [Marinimicrococcus flavescens]
MVWRSRGGKLSSRKVETAGPGTYDDGGGLRLTVRTGGSRSWTLRYQMAGRRRDMGLGRFPDVSLAKAREKADAARRLVADGVDPLAERWRQNALTFEKAAEGLLVSKAPGWRNAKHADQWRSTLASYAYPKLGSLDVTRIETSDVLGVLGPIWRAKPETASRVRQRIEAVLDYAAAMGVRRGDNPARWRGHLDHLLPKPSKVRAVVHHAALDWREVPSFMAELASREGTAAKALAFAILTAARSGEVRGMRWRELDLEAAVWTVPADRIKAGKEHRVPLETAALVLLGQEGDPDALVFPGSKEGRTLSDMALTAVLRRMGRGQVTVHGFRSSFRDWAGETSGHPREVIEAALAHRLKDKAEAAYARGDLFHKRRRLMRDWATFCSRSPGSVVALAPVPVETAPGKPAAAGT